MNCQNALKLSEDTENYFFIQLTGLGSDFKERVNINAISLLAPKKVFLPVIAIVSIGFLACKCAIYQNTSKIGVMITVHSLIFLLNELIE